jgi:hypothetical protein
LNQTIFCCTVRRLEESTLGLWLQIGGAVGDGAKLARMRKWLYLCGGAEFALFLIVSGIRKAVK